MSTIRNPVWSKIPDESQNPVYEKCRNITEEIYKRIDITFQIKKLEGTATQSDISDYSEQIDSNELSNETDLFACDKSSLSSSTDPERVLTTCEKFINNNNNEEKVNKSVPIYRRPKKRFRKRVKKHQSIRNKTDSDCSSDDALPLCRVDVDTRDSPRGSPDSVMGVPNIVIVAKDKSKLNPPASHKSDLKQSKPESTEIQKTCDHLDSLKDVSETCTSDNVAILSKNQDLRNLEWSNCPICKISFREERGLRRHISMSHGDAKESKKTK